MSATKTGTPAFDSCPASSWRVLVLPVPVAPAMSPWRLSIDSGDLDAGVVEELAVVHGAADHEARLGERVAGGHRVAECLVHQSLRGRAIEGRAGNGKRIIGPCPGRAPVTATDDDVEEDGNGEHRGRRGHRPGLRRKLSGAASRPDELLERGAKPAAQASRLDRHRHALILEWVNHVDLMRIKGVGSSTRTCSRRPASTPRELAQRNAPPRRRPGGRGGPPSIVRRIPSESELADWIAQSKDLPKVVEH